MLYILLWDVYYWLFVIAQTDRPYKIKIFNVSFIKTKVEMRIFIDTQHWNPFIKIDYVNML